MDQVFTFMDVFATRYLTSSRFVQLGAKFIRPKIEKESHTVDNIEKEHESLPSLPLTSP